MIGKNIILIVHIYLTDLFFQLVLKYQYVHTARQAACVGFNVHYRNNC
ncbi:hypothetical protein A464_2277 [Salmonella bongori N268-08]|uniref:Uncharacterized protein n=1 Tax=Salmonella bongori N268-08 TaxID=1197719 RepID=S5NGT0_SALBN|nr:hypothetical protein A464_2277 [Salmonella bongori N268-08]